MKSFNNELYVHRNETFTYDKYFVGNNGAPYIVSKKWNNPYLLFTIASSRYEQKDRYKLNLWLDLDNGYNVNGELIKLPRFNSTIPYKLQSWPDVAPFEPDECVYYVTDNDGNSEYKYYSSDVDGNGNPGWLPYEFRVVIPFSQNVTKEWVEQNYVYSIQLVAGELVRDYLYNLLLNDPDVPVDEDGNKVIPISDDSDDTILLENASQQDMYDYAYELNSQYVDGVQKDGVLMNYSSVQYIVTPTKITVGSDINGGL